MHVYACLHEFIWSSYVQVSMEARGPKKDALAMELQTFGTHLIWVLGTYWIFGKNSQCS